MPPTLFQIFVLGLIQGAAELLPVSSSAHVIAAERLMRLNPSSPEMTFLLIMLHTGTMFAVIAYFWKAWRKSFFESSSVFANAILRIVLATLATAVVFLALEVLIKRVFLHNRPGAAVEDLFDNLYLIAGALAVSGAVITYSGLRTRADSREASPGADGRTVPLVPAAWIGALQGLVLPFRGFSRSGATISAGMLFGISKRASEEFSFALAVVITPPAILREFLRLLHARAAGAGAAPLGVLAVPGLVGMACSFVAGLLALRWLSGWLENGRWHYFGYYCFAAAAGVCALAALGS
ncbi:MAG: undecaprenyl-diphosphate phosphatase [Opitutaceae bacterium]